MLNKDPLKRYTLAQVAQHEFFNSVRYLDESSSPP